MAIDARDEVHYLAVSRRSLDGRNTIEVGYPVGRQDQYRLVELPDETDDEMWRLWVKDADLEKTLEAAE